MSFRGLVYSYEVKILKNYIYHLGNKNIFYPKELRFLQLIGKNEASKEVVKLSFPIIGPEVVLSAMYNKF